MQEEKKKVLLVEDDDIAALIAGSVLKDFNCQIDVAKNGQEAINMAKKNNYDIIYMDIGLPILSGIEACIAIREHEKENNIIKRVPIVAVTANRDENIIAQCYEVGMDKVVFKPFNKEKAEEFIKTCKP